MAKGLRGFEKVSSKKNDPDVKLPSRSTANAAAYDFFSPVSFTIEPKEFVTIPTGIKAYFQPDEVLHLYPRSSTGFKHGIMLRNTVAVIDSDYYNNPSNEGELFICLYNMSDKTFSLEKGGRLVQGVFQKVLLADDVVEEQRKGGLGSTGQ